MGRPKASEKAWAAMPQSVSGPLRLIVASKYSPAVAVAVAVAEEGMGMGKREGESGAQKCGA